MAVFTQSPLPFLAGRDQHLRLEPGQEPIPGYRLVEPLGEGGFGVVWKCQVTGGFHKAIKFVHGDMEEGSNAATRQELHALECIKAIRHPFLLTMERVEVGEGRLMIVTELADQNLAELLRSYQQRGLPGIPRDELLELMLEAAEALDVLNLQFGLQHLDVKPHNLLVLGRHVKVADFGLVNRLESSFHGGASGGESPGVTPLYASPEVLQGKVRAQSDQYSLAIVYQELLTGVLPFHGTNARHLILQHLQAQPDLTPLPEADRPQVARALAKDPSRRFTTCVDFIQALILGIPETQAASPSRSNLTPLMLRVQRKSLPTAEPAAVAEAPRPESLVTVAEFQHLNCQEQNTLGEQWAIRLPAGTRKIAHRLLGFSCQDPAKQFQAIKKLQAIRLKALLPFEVAEIGPARIVLVTDCWENTLQDLCQERLANQREIPVAELIETLGLAAAALDELAGKGLYHLALHPAAILVNRDRVQLLHFGLAQHFWAGTPGALARLNPLYGAPELAEDRPGAASDQYGLALLYAELRSGLKGRLSPAKFSSAVSRASTIALLLYSLGESEREVLRRALATDPGKRFSTCTEFIDALELAVQSSPQIVEEQAPETVIPLDESKETLVEDLVRRLQADQEVRDNLGFRFRHFPGNRLEHYFAVPLLASQVRDRLEILCQEWGATILVDECHRQHFFLPSERNLWQRWLERRVGLEVALDLRQAPVAKLTRTYLTVRIKPLGCKSNQVSTLLEEAGPRLLANLRQSLAALPEERREERLELNEKIQITMVEDPAVPVFQGQSRDISRKGIGLITPAPLAHGARIEVTFPDDESTPPPLTARVVRCGELPEGNFIIGAVFVG